MSFIDIITTTEYTFCSAIMPDFRLQQKAYRLALLHADHLFSSRGETKTLIVERNFVTSIRQWFTMQNALAIVGVNICVLPYPLFLLIAAEICGLVQQLI